ncbi:MAG: AAA family ATPase, partial [Parcubacteria group bacterium]|nr:AAA family ATPase [Parcubacteria group bacterium]
MKNYRALADFALGQTEYAHGDSLPMLSCLIGPNGSGKSTVLDAFGFVADCLLEGVEAACDKPQRGGFDRIRTQGSAGPVQFEIFFEAGDARRP